MEAPHDIRFKGKTVRLLSALLAGMLLLLAGGLLGLSLTISAIAAAVFAALVFFGWVPLFRLYSRLFRAGA